MPEMPTIAEAGVPGFEVTNWWGIVAPAGTPTPVLDRLYKEINLILDSPETRKRFELEGAEVIRMKPARIDGVRGDGNREMDPRGKRSRHQAGMTMDPFKAYKLTETPDRKIKAEFVDMTLDDLDAGDVVVRVAYSDVNYKDALAATGKGRILRRQSCVGGIDLSGTVVSSTNPGFKKAMPCSASASISACRITAATRSTRACRASG